MAAPAQRSWFAFQPLKCCLRCCLQDLEEERQNNCALKETLAETLAVHAQGARAGATFNPDSAAHVTIKLLDSLIMGEDVAIEDVLQARDSLLRAGNNVWKVGFRAQARCEGWNLKQGIAARCLRECMQRLPATLVPHQRKPSAAP